MATLTLFSCGRNWFLLTIGSSNGSLYPADIGKEEPSIAGGEKRGDLSERMFPRTTPRFDIDLRRLMHRPDRRGPIVSPAQTDMHRRSMCSCARESFSSGEPAGVVAALAWLLDPAQGWGTGQVLGVDGGLGSVRARGTA